MFLGQDGFIWWLGVVEDIADPLLLGRAKVRIFGYHAPYNTNEEVATPSSNGTPISELPWAHTIMPTNMPDAYGKPKLGDWVLGFFLDGKEAQEPMILGYLPGLSITADEKFGKNFSATRNFNHVYSKNTYFDGSGEQYSALLNRFSHQTASGHKLEMIDHLSPSQNRELSIVHAAGAYHRMSSDLNGNSTIRIGHPKGSYIEFDSQGGIMIKNSIGSYVEVGSGGTISIIGNSVRIDPPAEPPLPPDSGGDCFTKDSLVIMANGSLKKISEIEVGEYVMSRTHDKANRVMFIERVIDTTWESLYSPDEKHEPFATINHPLYYGGRLCSPNAERVQKLYPWLGKIEQLHNCKIVPTTGETVYNLWLDGDGTYVVNGYGTTSIMMDGGLLRIAHERGYLSHDEVMDLVLEFTSDTANLQYGAYIINGIVGKLNFDWLFKFFAWVSRKPKTNLVRRSIIQLMRFTSLIYRR